MTAAPFLVLERADSTFQSEMLCLQDLRRGRYDFTRLTHLGHLRLFRHFQEMASGACGGLNGADLVVPAVLSGICTLDLSSRMERKWLPACCFFEFASSITS